MWVIYLKPKFIVQEKTINFNKNTLEIVSLNGKIDPNSCHLHMIFSDGNCNLWAGHLKEGSIILKAADMLLGFLDKNLNKDEKAIHY